MEKNKTLITIVVILLVMVVGVSFAYFVVNATINNNTNPSEIVAGDMLKVKYDAGSSKLEADNLFPGDIASKSFKVTVTPTKDIKEVIYAIILNITENTFLKCTDENYDEITNNCEKNAQEIIYRLKDSTGSVIKTGDLTGVTGQVEIGRETKIQEVETEYNYTIEIEFKDTNKDQNHNQNKVIEAEVNVEFAEKPITISDIIVANNPKNETPDFTSAATTDEGVYSVSDGMYGGTSYYFRGAVENNYVTFGGFCWRIIRINGDGSMRLIYDGTSCHANGTNTEDSIALTNQQYNNLYDKSYYVGWTYAGGLQRPASITFGTDSNAKAQLENWFMKSIKETFRTMITDGKYCNDRSTEIEWNEDGETFYYGSYYRIQEFLPTLECQYEDTYVLKVGMITADEVIMAGGNKNSNKSYYLYNGKSYWTMSPYRWYANGYAGVVFFRNDGALSNWAIYNNYGLRPVINLKSDTEFKLGTDGTLNNPYEVI